MSRSPSPDAPTEVVAAWTAFQKVKVRSYFVNTLVGGVAAFAAVVIGSLLGWSSTVLVLALILWAATVAVTTLFEFRAFRRYMDVQMAWFDRNLRAIRDDPEGTDNP